MKKTLLIFAQTTFALALTLFIAYFAMNMGPFRWLLQTKGGMQAYIWLLHSWGGSGIEDGEDMLILLALGIALSLAILICKIIRQFLKKL
jgi:F0F1-type ATP synthase membrane subunit a